jgi:hypothetical protein
MCSYVSNDETWGHVMCFAEQQRSRSVCINKDTLINNLEEIRWILVDIFEDVLYILRSMNYSKPSSIHVPKYKPFQVNRQILHFHLNVNELES